MNNIYNDIKDILDILYPNYPFMYYPHIRPDEIYIDIKGAFSAGTLSWSLGLCVVRYRNTNITLERVINKVVSRISRLKGNEVEGMHYFIGFRKFDGEIIRRDDIKICNKKINL